jgi:hypothetical protein
MPAYQPNELMLFQRILEDAIAQMPAMKRTSCNKALIARRILDCAATGERDPVELQLAALTDFKPQNQRAG